MFKIPEQYRVRKGPLASDGSFGNNGMFVIPAGSELIPDNTGTLTKAPYFIFVVASDQESWKPIKGYEELYEISNYGKVRAKPKQISMPNGGARSHPVLEISQEKLTKGYLRVSLCTDGKIDKRLLHVLVAETFIDNPNNYPFVNHIDGVKQYCFVENLEWCTEEYNNHHAIELGLREGFKAEQILYIKSLLDEGKTTVEVADLFNKSRQAISHIKNGRHRDLNPELPTKYSGTPIWEHISIVIHTIGPPRAPVKEEVDAMRNMFWGKDDQVFQYMPSSKYKDEHPLCVQLWRKPGAEMPVPPAELYGLQKKSGLLQIAKKIITG